MILNHYMSRVYIIYIIDKPSSSPSKLNTSRLNIMTDCNTAPLLKFYFLTLGIVSYYNFLLFIIITMVMTIYSYLGK